MPMEIKTLYKLISGESVEIEDMLNTLSREGSRPVTMSCRSTNLNVILENKAMEEGKLSISNAVAGGMLKESEIEEIQ
jgi:hypothetical protein